MLELAVFICGAAVMVVELVAVRVLAPFLGTSVVVWTSIIGVILAAMSAGYWWGGRLADRRPTPSALSLVIVLASVCTALISFSRNFLVEAITAGVGGAHLGSLLAAGLLFAPAALLLGMVSPFAARIRMTGADTAGSTVGRLYAVSTLGSIVGTFAGGYFFIAYLGSANILLATAAALAVAAMLCHGQGMLMKAGLASAYLFLMALSRADAKMLAAQGVVDTDTAYQRVLVYMSQEAGTGRSMRVMTTGPEGVQGAVFPDDPAELALAYSRFFRLGHHFRPAAQSVLVLGGGSYAYPKYSLKHHPDASLDVVELDPGVTALAEKHFDLRTDRRLRVIHEDARTFLNANAKRYDIILSDVFNSSVAIPFHLTTLEAARRTHQALADGGVLLVNCIAAREGVRAGLLGSLAATYAAVFKQVHVIRVRDAAQPAELQNFIIAAFKDDAPRSWTSPDQSLDKMLSQRFALPETRQALVLTDDFAPVERFVGGFTRD